MEVILEELSKGHKLLSRHKFSQKNITIGRAYHSDIILSDPHVCAEHLTIEHDGECWRIVDQNSVNGIYLQEQKQSANGHIIRSGDIITLGKSQLRIVFPYHPVADSIILSPFENLIKLTKHPLVLSANIAIFTLLTAWVMFLNSAKEMNFTKLLVPTIGVTLMFVAWPALVALIAHLNKNDARVFTQIGVCFVIYNIFWLTDLFENIVIFNSASYSAFTDLVLLIPIVLAFSLFWLNCYISFHMSQLKRTVIATGLTTLLFGGSFLVQLSKQSDFSVKPQFDNTLLSPNFVITGSSNVDEFIDNSAKLFEQVQKEALKEEP